MAETETTEETTDEGGLRSQMWKHEAMVEWINEQRGVDLDSMSAADVIAYAFADRVSWRKSAVYADLVRSHAQAAEEAKAQRAAEREAAKEAKRQEREAAKAEKAAAEAAKAEAAAEGEKPAKATKSAKKTVRKATKASAPAAEEADPFE